MEQSIFGTNLGIFLRVFCYSWCTLLELSPSVFVERLNNLAARASTPDDNELLVKTYDFRQTKLSRGLERVVC